MKYIIEFSKTGIICYTSHLDIMKVFKRAFKKAGINIAYSQGFNPHPKMGFAQPLSLGYWGLQEYVEFETAEENMDSQAADVHPADPEDLLAALSAIMPEGLELKRILEAPWLKKTLAAENIAAEYMIEIPLGSEAVQTLDEGWESFMDQPQIQTLKKQKKKKEPVLIDIKPKIQTLAFQCLNETLYINTLLDAGSESNLSPELLITSLLDFLKLPICRSDINVARKRLIFKEDTQSRLNPDVIL